MTKASNAPLETAWQAYKTTATADTLNDVITQLAPLMRGIVVMSLPREMAPYIDDAVQAALCKAWSNLDTCKGDRIAPWAGSIARHAAMDAIRKQRRHPTSQLDENCQSTLGLGQAIRRDTRPANLTPEETRMCYLLSEFSSEREISDVMGIPRPQVHKVIASIASKYGHEYHQAGV
jgi:DNA-directed RNA polymerase specialized sigma24 family protein